MKSFLKENRIFFSLYAAFLVAGAAIIATLEHGSEILYFNALHTPQLNSFFKAVTQLAEAPLFMLAIIIAIRFSYGKGLVLAVNALLVLGFTTFLKHIVFDGVIRPSVFFEGKVTLNFVQGLEVLRHNSFPSGHTAGAFGAFCMLSLLVTNKKWRYLFFTAALLVGVSWV